MLYHNKFLIWYVESRINQTLNSDLDVRYFVQALFHLHKFLKDEIKPERNFPHISIRFTTNLSFIYISQVSIYTCPGIIGHVEILLIMLNILAPPPPPAIASNTIFIQFSYQTKGGE